MKLSQLKMALDALNSQYDLTLNTDGSYESVRSKEKILKRHRTTHRSYADERKIIHEVIDAYLELRKFIDEAEREKTIFVHMMIDKSEPFSISRAEAEK